MIDVVLVAPVRAYREAFAAAIAPERGLRLVGQAASGTEALACMTPLHPTVALLDFAIDDVVRLLGALRRAAPTTRLVGVGIGPGRAQSEAVVRAAQVGVAGFVDCDQPLSVVLDAIRMAVRGESSCSPRIAALILRAMQSRPVPPTMPPGTSPRIAPHLVLTPRESLVAELAARGLTNRQIAVQLVVGESTVKTHMHAALQKLGLRSRGELGLTAGGPADGDGAPPPGGAEVELGSPPLFSTPSR